MKNRTFLTTIITSAAACLLLTAPVSASQGWNKNNTGWWWENADGSYPAAEWLQTGNTWYHFDGNGYMQTGWVKVGTTWYYMNSDGAMQTGWVKVGSTWYYMNSDGAMQTNTYVDGCYLNESGAWTDTKAPESGEDTGYTAPPTNTHTHNWVENTEAVYIEEVGHWEEYMKYPSATSPITEQHLLCAHCGYDYTIGGYNMSHMCPDGTTSASYGCQTVIVGEEIIPAVYEKKWVVDTPAHVEQQGNGTYKCSICGAEK